MGLIENLRDILSGEKEIEISYREAPELLEDHKSREVRKVRSKESGFRDKTENLVEELESDLDKLQDYRDIQDLDIVEDVARDFARSRKLMIGETDLSGSLDEHLEALQDLLERFNDVTDKQGQVIKRITSNTKVLKAVEELEDHSEEIEDFLEEQYAVLKDLNRLKELVNQIDDLKSDIQSKREVLENEDIEPSLERKERLEKEIEELKESEEWKRLEELRDLREDKKEQRSEIEEEITSNISSMSRGLKKVLYQARSGEIEFEGDIGKLEDLSEKRYDQLEDIQAELDEVLNKIRQKELLDSRSTKRFADSVEELSNFGEMKERSEKLSEELESLEEEIEELEIEGKLQELERELESTENKIEKSKNRKKRVKNEIEKYQELKSQKIEEIEDILNRVLRPEISVHLEE